MRKKDLNNFNRFVVLFLFASWCHRSLRSPCSCSYGSIRWVRSPRMVHRSGGSPPLFPVSDFLGGPRKLAMQRESPIILSRLVPLQWDFSQCFSRFYHLLYTVCIINIRNTVEQHGTAIPSEITPCHMRASRANLGAKSWTACARSIRTRVTDRHRQYSLFHHDINLSQSIWNALHSTITKFSGWKFHLLKWTLTSVEELARHEVPKQGSLGRG